MLIFLALAGGALVGMLEVEFGRPSWVLSLGLTVLAVSLLTLARYWIGTPFDQLVEQLERIKKDYHTDALSKLPMDRYDEVGQIARLIHDIGSVSVRNHNDAAQLRRTLDHRVAQATQRATHELRRLVMRDPLTGLGNRRFLDEQFEPLVRSIRESGSEMVCIAIDVDNFKGINDTLGHAAGDELLKFLGQLIRGLCRGGDYAIRLGGDEFVILLPGCGVPRAVQFAEQLVALFSQHTQHTLPPSCPTSLSVGVAGLADSDPSANAADLLRRADEALYSAKRGGKNRVCDAPPRA
ncbi:MAG: diguanylate cyclase [Planctomycetes bacterium]|nr:diguanylate cyclase [Planctomycetota bacterium]